MKRDRLRDYYAVVGVLTWCVVYGGAIVQAATGPVPYGLSRGGYALFFLTWGFLVAVLCGGLWPLAWFIGMLWLMVMSVAA